MLEITTKAIAIKKELEQISQLKDYVLNQSDVKAELHKIQTEYQMFEFSENALGESLGKYTNFTKKVKKNKGQRFDHITLRDTGAFYRSFRFNARKGDIYVTANTITDEGTDLEDRFGKLSGLNENSIPFFIEFVQPIFLQTLRERLVQGGK